MRPVAGDVGTGAKLIPVAVKIDKLAERGRTRDASDGNTNYDGVAEIDGGLEIMCSGKADHRFDGENSLASFCVYSAGEQLGRTPTC